MLTVIVDLMGHQAWILDLSHSSIFLSSYHIHNRFVIHICSMNEWKNVFLANNLSIWLLESFSLSLNGPQTKITEFLYHCLSRTWLLGNPSLLLAQGSDLTVSISLIQWFSTRSTFALQRPSEISGDLCVCVCVCVCV